MDHALVTRGLRRVFGDFVAVDGIDLEVPRGSLYGFLGPNGAGKSTTIKCLTGLLRPSGGTMTILGLDPAAKPEQVKRLVGVMPEDLALFDHLSAAETLAFVGQVHGMDAATLKRRSEELLALMDLAAASGQLVADYSHGMRKKTSLAAALLPGPKVLFLDEPFEGIDAIASRQIKDLLLHYVRNGGTVFLTSHVLDVVERLCDHIGVIHKGRLVAQGSLASMRAGSRRARRSSRSSSDSSVRPGATGRSSIGSADDPPPARLRAPALEAVRERPARATARQARASVPHLARARARPRRPRFLPTALSLALLAGVGGWGMAQGNEKAAAVLIGARALIALLTVLVVVTPILRFGGSASSMGVSCSFRSRASCSGRSRSSPSSSIRGCSRSSPP
jgi:ABC-2 type transport system ATP-binding protein